MLFDFLGFEFILKIMSISTCHARYRLYRLYQHLTNKTWKKKRTHIFWFVCNLSIFVHGRTTPPIDWWIDLTTCSMVKQYIPANIPCDKINWNIVDDCTRSSNSLVSFKLPRSWNDDTAISMRCELYKMRLLRLVYVLTTRHLHLLEIIQCHFLIVRLRWCQKTNSYRILDSSSIWTRYVR